MSPAKPRSDYRRSVKRMVAGGDLETIRDGLVEKLRGNEYVTHLMMEGEEHDVINAIGGYIDIVLAMRSGTKEIMTDEALYMQLKVKNRPSALGDFTDRLATAGIKEPKAAAGRLKKLVAAGLKEILEESKGKA